MATTITLPGNITEVLYGTTSLDKVNYGTTTVWEKPDGAYDYIDADTTLEDYVPFDDGVDTKYITICPFPRYGAVTVTLSYDTRNTLQVSTDKETWTTITENYSRTSKYPLYVRGTGTVVPTIGLSGGMISVSGQVSSLIRWVDPYQASTGISYTELFKGCNTLYDASGLKFVKASNKAPGIFSACVKLKYAPTSMGTNGSSIDYGGAFYRCMDLVTAPALPATGITNNCYMDMFANCTSLAVAPALPATSLATQCYYDMFSGCSNLTTPPSLPATTLTEACYFGMFGGCTSLVNAPELPATTLADECYKNMFSRCTSLTNVVIKATTIDADADTIANMLTGTTGTGTVMRYASWNIGDSAFRTETEMPDGWTFQDL